jgi:hypothetical protein
MGRFVTPVGVRLGVGKSWDHRVGYANDDVLKTVEYINYIKQLFLIKISKRTGILLSHIRLDENADKIILNIYVYSGRIFDDYYLVHRNSRKYSKVKIKNYLNSLIFLKNRYVYWFKVIKYVSEIYWQKKIQINVYNLYQNMITAKLLCNFLKIQLKRGFAVPELMKFVRKKFERSNVLRGYRVDFGGRFRRKERAEYNRVLFGRLPTSSVTSNVDYWHEVVILKYGACSLRVWLFKSLNKSNYINKVVL